jgi:hypothetical protein
VVGVTDAVLDTRPTVSAVALVGAVGLLGAIALVAAPEALALGLLGTLLLAAGTATGTDGLVGLGALAGLGGVALGATAGVGVVYLLVATTGTLVAWDGATQALDLGETVGREADSQRALSIHTAVAAGVACLAAGGGYVVYLVVGDGQPVGALVLLLAGAVLLAGALR